MENNKFFFALCIENKECDDLEKRKVYQIIHDEAAENEGYYRIIDESGEDYLYPASHFVLIDLPVEAAESFGLTAIQ